jgi:hypothetical protein
MQKEVLALCSVTVSIPSSRSIENCIMSQMLTVTILLCAVVAGLIGWRRATKHIYRRSLYPIDPPAGVSRDAHERAVRRRRKLRRPIVTLLYAMAGALIGLVPLLFLTRH